MAKGRKRLPDNVKDIRDTLRQDRTNPYAPIVDPGAPKSPSWLPVEAREYFGVLKERLDGINLSSRTNTEMMALAALRLSEIDALNEIIDKDGPVYKSTKLDKDGEPVTELIKSNPAVSQRSEAMRHLQSLLAEFGLSPASVGKVSVDKDKKQENRFDRFKIRS